MKALLVLAATISVTYAGVGYLTPQEERHALRLYNNYCSGNSNEVAAGNTIFYCKKAPNEYREELRHVIRLNPRNLPEQRQVIFVSPPPLHFRHNLNVIGKHGGQQKAIIYVLPPKHTHKIEHSDLRDAVRDEPPKPTVFFLKSDPTSSGVSSSGSIAIEADDNGSSPTYPILPVPPTSKDYAYSPNTDAQQSDGGYY